MHKYAPKKPKMTYRDVKSELPEKNRMSIFREWEELGFMDVTEEDSCCIYDDLYELCLDLKENGDMLSSSPLTTYFCYIGKDPRNHLLIKDLFHGTQHRVHIFQHGQRVSEAFIKSFDTKSLLNMLILRLRATKKDCIAGNFNGPLKKLGEDYVKYAPYLV